MNIENNYFFGGLEIQEKNFDKARIIVLPICYENASSYGKGSKKGSLHILKASSYLERIDEITLTDWGNFNIFTLNPVYPSTEPEKAIQQIKIIAKKIMGNEKFLLSLGGDHAISIGTIGAASKIFNEIGVLQIDAHLDLRNEWNGSRYNHACVMRRVVEDIGVPIIQIGIRSFSQEEADYVKKNKIAPFYAHDIDLFNNIWMKRALDILPDNIYLTLDLDGLDPSVIPGTGTPEPGGLLYSQVVDLIMSIGEKKQLIAADICELVKIEGNHVSEFIAAKLATKIFISKFFFNL